MNDTVNSNGGAYTTCETRSGPPLGYVSEKLRGAIESLHSMHRMALMDIPDDLVCPARHKAARPTYNPKLSSVIGPCFEAFRYSVTSYLALNNFLGLANPSLYKALLEMPSKDFEKWLDNVTREGSVT